MKTLIAVPCMDQVPAQFAQALATLNKVGDCKVAFQIGSLIYTSRNELATRALKMDADYVLWLDSDMIFYPDTLTRMMKHMEYADIVTGVYYRRVAPYTPVLFDTLEINDAGCAWTDYKDKDIPNDFFEVGGCGFGCVLMKAEIFLDVQSRFGNMFAPIGNVGEDLSFCWRARECGFKIYCDPSIVLGHVGHTVITQEFYKSYRQAKEARYGAG